MDRISTIDGNTIELKRGEFVTYYDPVVEADCLINVQDWYWANDIHDENKKVKKWVYYKAFNLSRKHLYHDGSRMVIVFEDYGSVRVSTPEEISQYLKALKEEGLTL